MKKIIAIVLLMATLITLVSCGDSEKVQAKVIDIELTQEEYAFGVDKAQPELLEKVNEFIQSIIVTGTFDDICDHYFGEGKPVAVKSAELDPTKDQLVVATHASFEPFEYKSGDDYYGIDMEIAALLADELGMELVISDMEFKDILSAVSEQKADIAMSALTIQEDRTKYVDFSEPYYQASQKIIALDDDTAFDNCKTAEDVLKKLQTMSMSTTIGYQSGTTGGMYVTSSGVYESNKLRVTGKSYENGSLAVQDLLNGDIKYVVIDAAPAERIVKALNAAEK